ncbi:MAG: quinolinate synthase NadA [Thermodesulfobacteriota bacterium]
MIQKRIKELKTRRNAIILVHNYQPPEIQDIADLCGDSLELSIRASQTSADVIVFCGVHFMAETASIVCPDKTVLLPRLSAGCPMADMVTPQALEERLAELGPMPVVTYVNSPASVKALSTVCCTSANVVKVVNSLMEKEILMTPDRNLAAYAQGFTDKTLHLWNGWCPVHDALRPEDIEAARRKHPGALVMAHPECRPEVTALADVVLSTSGMLRHAQESDRAAFIVATENGILYPLKKACPGKQFYCASEAMECPDMKKIGLADVAACLESLTPEVKVPADIQQKALAAVQRMLKIV